MAPKANSGVIWHVLETEEQTYMTGPEYQVLDDQGSNPPGKHAAGALYKIEADVPLQYTLESVEDTVRVPAGEYHGCLRIRASGSTLAEVRKQVGLAEIKVEQVDWYAPGVGLVRSERRETTSSSALPSGTLEVELERVRQP